LDSKRDFKTEILVLTSHYTHISPLKSTSKISVPIGSTYRSIINNFYFSRYIKWTEYIAWYNVILQKEA